MFEHPRPVRWSDVDAAGIAYFPRFLEMCHDAVEALFAALPGGYPALTMGRRVGVPAVHLDCDFRAPLRYGDVCRVQVRVLKLGRSSVTFRHDLYRERDRVLAAVVRHVVVTSDLDQVKSVEMPPDVRALLAAHLEPDESP